jgi:hypothetical protein
MPLTFDMPFDELLTYQGLPGTDDEIYSLSSTL